MSNLTHVSSHSIIRWYRSLSTQHKALLYGIFFIGPSVISATISYYVRQYFEGDFKINLVVILVMYLALVSLVRYVTVSIELMEQETEQRRKVISQAIPSLDDLVAKRLKRLHEVHERYKSIGSAAFASDLFQVAVASIDHVQNLVEELHRVVETQFGGPLTDPVDFEVTFMTRSYRDNNITIYASQNRDRRAPLSLLLRDTDPHIYEKTVTAEIYRSVKPAMKIIENTAHRDEAGNERYNSLYTGQLDRIKSSIVYPVLSASNQLLGTVVVHCNKVSFFKEVDKRFWQQLLEIYAKRIAYEKICLDVFLELDLARWAAEINRATLIPPH